MTTAKVEITLLKSDLPSLRCSISSISCVQMKKQPPLTGGPGAAGWRSSFQVHCNVMNNAFVPNCSNEHSQEITVPTAGIDQAALSEQQQLTARQLQQQQKAEALVGDSPDVQRAAAADAREEVAGYGDEEQVSATPGLGSPLEAPAGGEDDAMPADAPAVLDQPVSELSAAEPAEASPQTLEPEPKVETPALSRLSEAADLSVDERIDVFLEAIRTRSWEQTNRQPVNMADGAVTELKLPASGYSEIGSVSSGRLQGQVLNPTRTFYPGQTYEPEVCTASDSCLPPCFLLLSKLRLVSSDAVG